MFCSVMPTLPSMSWRQELSKVLQIKNQKGRGHGYLIGSRLGRPPGSFLGHKGIFSFS